VGYRSDARHEGTARSRRSSKDRAFNAAGNLVLTGSDDGDARAWDLESGQTLFLFHGHGNVPAADFSADGQRVLTTDRRGLVRSYACEACGPIESVLRAAVQRDGLTGH